jgi:uncharacterized protein YjdB
MTTPRSRLFLRGDIVRAFQIRAGLVLVAMATGACSNGSNIGPSRVVSVRVVPDSVSLAAGDTVRAAAFPLDADTAFLPHASVSWSTESAAVATVSPSGLVTAVAPGSTMIDATASGIVGRMIVVVP